MEMNDEMMMMRRKSSSDVFVTWTDLWVAVAGDGGDRYILRELTGYARPGEVLAIMGPSGCGKSTLLDTLAGRVGPNTRQTGDILINGRKETLAFGTSAYVTQDDTLITTLTVKEAVYYSAQLQLPYTMSRLEKMARAEATIKEMGLQDAMNTRIGGGFGAKGLSGGQKRRVSICMELLAHPRLLFLDEPTSGLDSAASFYVMHKIASLAAGSSDGMRRTIVLSIHQPSSEVFQLFHNLCLLSAGNTVYFGPTSSASNFFASNGFPCPALQNPSDHFLKTINKDFEKDIEKGLSDTISAEEAIETLVQSYKCSNYYHQVRDGIDQILKQDYDAMESRRSHASFFTQCSVLTRRSCVNMCRDLGYYWLRLAIYLALALASGTVFIHLKNDYKSIDARCSLMMFVATFLTFMSIGGFPSFAEEMKVLKRERLNGHYGVAAFTIGNIISSLPFLILISLIPGAVTYYLPGLQKGCIHFLYFTAVLLSSVMVVESLMMIIASLVPNFLMGIITGAGLQGLMILVGGFFRLPNELPNLFWRYPLYHIAFHKYAYQGLFKNEFEGKVFLNVNDGGGPRDVKGEEILEKKWEMEMGYSKWVDLGILMGMVVAYRLLFILFVKIREMDATKKSLCMRYERSAHVMANPHATPLRMLEM